MIVSRWEYRMLSLAHFVAQWSKDPSTQVGAAIVRPDNSVASVGFNGFPRGVLDLPERYSARDVKYAMVVHAEANAILHAKEPLHGMTLYITMPPCASCSGLIIQSGISKIVFPAPTEDQLDRWGPSMSRAKRMLEEAGIEIKQIDNV